MLGSRAELFGDRPTARFKFLQTSSSGSIAPSLGKQRITNGKSTQKRKYIAGKII